MELSESPRIAVSGTALTLPENPILDGLPPRIVVWDSELDDIAPDEVDRARLNEFISNYDDGDSSDTLAR